MTGSAPLPHRPRRRPRRRAGGAALAGVLLLGGVLAGCSGGDAPGDGGASPAESAVAPSPASSVSSASSASPSSSDPSASEPPTTTVVTSMTTFTAPSGNISCYLAPVQGADPYARCDLKQTSWAEPEPEGGCDGRWGGGEGGFGSVGVGGGDAEYLCVGDDVADPSAPALPYGSSIVMEPLTCTSTDKGMTCTNSKTQHGFTARKADPKLF